MGERLRTLLPVRHRCFISFHYYALNIGQLRARLSYVERVKLFVLVYTDVKFQRFLPLVLRAYTAMYLYRLDKQGAF